MSRLYSTIISNRKNQRTKCGDHWIQSSLQTYDGSVIMSIEWRDPDYLVEIGVSNGSQDMPQRIIWRGRLQELMAGVLQSHLPETNGTHNFNINTTVTEDIG